MAAEKDQTKNAIRILVLEDLEEDVELMISCLETSTLVFTYRRASVREEYERELVGFRPDILLVDYTLPDINGLEAMNLARKQDEYIPVIFVTGTLKVEKAIDIMQEGANDFILKKNLSDLPKSIYRATRQAREARARQKAEAALRESEARFKMVADSAPALIWMTDTRTQGVFFNQGWVKYTGRTTKELKGKGWLADIYPEDREAFVSLLEEAYHTRTSFSTEFRLQNHNGEYCWMLNRSNPRFEGETNFQGFISTCIDITELKTLEKNKIDFLSIASHELKTPLSTIKAFTQLIKREIGTLNGNQSLQEYINQTETAANRLQHLISEMINVSRIENGIMELRREVVDFDDFVKKFLNNYRLANPNLHLVFQGYTNAQVAIDPEKIGQVLENLLSNAVKYSPESSRIEVIISREKDHVSVAVKDYGIGIHDDHFEAIFTRYYRIEEIRNTFSGLGVGLYLSQQIVEVHQGKIKVESKVGAGSVFYVELPIFNLN